MKPFEGFGVHRKLLKCVRNLPHNPDIVHVNRFIYYMHFNFFVRHWFLVHPRFQWVSDKNYGTHSHIYLLKTIKKWIIDRQWAVSTITMRKQHVACSVWVCVLSGKIHTHTRHSSISVSFHIIFISPFPNELPSENYFFMKFATCVFSHASSSMLWWK